jgi:hypothetical protein
MLILFFFFFSLFILFLSHIILQRIFLDQLIKNFLISSVINFLLLNSLLIEYEVNLDNQILLYLNTFLAQIIYLIIIQSLRSSIQIYILQNCKKIDIKNLQKEELKIFEYRMFNLQKNNIIEKKNDIVKDNSKMILNLTYYIFYIMKKIYNQKF